MKDFLKRISYKGELEDISLLLCKDFNLGEFKSNKLLTVGFEDFNFILETTDNKYFIKIFSDFRSEEDCQRYIEVMLEVMGKKISLPEIFSFNNEYLQIREIEGYRLRFCIMEFIDGKDFYLLNQKPNEDEIRFLAHQAALINSIELNPEFVYDQWAIVNFLDEFKKKKEYLSEKDLSLIEPLIEKFKELNIDELPHCFAHGDIITTNVIRDKDNKLWIIDFAASNYYPRIQELAVLACNLLFNEEDRAKSERNLKIALEEYQKVVKLTPKELEALPAYIRLAHAMHLLSANYEKEVEKDDSEENEYWLNQGRIGLLQTLIS